MTDLNCWFQTDDQLVACIPSASDAQGIIAQYESILQQWRMLKHPAILEIDRNVKIKELDNKGVLEITVTSQKIGNFKPSRTIVPSFTTFEKLFLLKQTIDLDGCSQNLGLVWKMTRLYVHSSGICGWLPPLPNDVHNRTDIILFLFELFDLKMVDLNNWHDLQKNGKIPWEWGTFIECYLSEDESVKKVNLLKLFSFVFFQSWLYTTANRLGMKDKVMSKNEYNTLYQFGLNLGLSAEIVQELNVIAQQPPAWKNLLVLLDDDISEK